MDAHSAQAAGGTGAQASAPTTTAAEGGRSAWGTWAFWSVLGLFGLQGSGPRPVAITDGVAIFAGTDAEAAETSEEATKDQGKTVDGTTARSTMAAPRSNGMVTASGSGDSEGASSSEDEEEDDDDGLEAQVVEEDDHGRSIEQPTQQLSLWGNRKPAPVPTTKQPVLQGNNGKTKMTRVELEAYHEECDREAERLAQATRQFEGAPSAPPEKLVLGGMTKGRAVGNDKDKRHEESEGEDGEGEGEGEREAMPSPITGAEDKASGAEHQTPIKTIEARVNRALLATPLVELREHATYSCVYMAAHAGRDKEGIKAADNATPQPIGYWKGKKLGSGTFGTVQLANKLTKKVEVHMNDGTPMYKATVVNEPVAIKTHTQMWDKEGKLEGDVHREVEMHRLVQHKNIMQLLETFVTWPGKKGRPTLHLVIEYCANGDLYQLMYKNHIPPEHALSYSYQLFDALKHLAKNDILHNDLKDSNVMIKGHVLKLGDLGCSCRSKESENFLWAGNVQFQPPETIMSVSRDFKADVWAAGFAMYSLFYHYLPVFVNDSDADETVVASSLRDETLHLLATLVGLPSREAWADGVDKFSDRMRDSDDGFPSDVTDTSVYPRAEDMPLQTFLRARTDVRVEDEITSLLSRLLSFNPSQRPNAADVLEDPVFFDMTYDEEGKVLTRTLKNFIDKPNTLPALVAKAEQSALGAHREMNNRQHILNAPLSPDDQSQAAALMPPPDAKDSAARGAKRPRASHNKLIGKTGASAAAAAETSDDKEGRDGMPTPPPPELKGNKKRKRKAQQAAKTAKAAAASMPTAATTGAGATGADAQVSAPKGKKGGKKSEAGGSTTTTRSAAQAQPPAPARAPRTRRCTINKTNDAPAEKEVAKKAPGGKKGEASGSSSQVGEAAARATTMNTRGQAVAAAAAAAHVTVAKQGGKRGPVNRKTTAQKVKKTRKAPAPQTPVPRQGRVPRKPAAATKGPTKKQDSKIAPRKGQAAGPKKGKASGSQKGKASALTRTRRQPTTPAQDTAAVKRKPAATMPATKLARKAPTGRAKAQVAKGEASGATRTTRKGSAQEKARTAKEPTLASKKTTKHVAKQAPAAKDKAVGGQKGKASGHQKVEASASTKTTRKRTAPAHPPAPPAPAAKTKTTKAAARKAADSKAEASKVGGRKRGRGSVDEEEAAGQQDGGVAKRRKADVGERKQPAKADVGERKQPLRGCKRRLDDEAAGANAAGRSKKAKC